MDRIDPWTLADLARRWRVRSLAVFGSVARDEHTSASDLDLLVDFEDDAPWSLIDLARFQEELEHLAQRPVDLVERQALVNPYRRRAILRDARMIYEAV